MCVLNTVHIPFIPSGQVHLCTFPFQLATGHALEGSLPWLVIIARNHT